MKVQYSILYLAHFNEPRHTNAHYKKTPLLPYASTHRNAKKVITASELIVQKNWSSGG